MKPSFIYAATVLSVHDGDTIAVDADMGMSVHFRTNVRFLGCNAIELSQPGGIEARDNLRTLLAPGTPIVMRTVKDDKYGGRWLAAVSMPDGSDLISTLIAAHFAAAWDGTGTRPVPPWPRPEAGTP